MGYIPDELLLEILLRLQARDIYCAARLVCRKWYHMTRSHNFISTHFQRTSYGLLYDDEHRDIVFISFREGQIQTHKLITYEGIFPIWTSCNGLVLEEDRNNRIVYVIANRSTDQVFRLPPCPDVTNFEYFIGIGYVPASSTYKVFATGGVLLGEGCNMLTVGVDKSWRYISTHHLSLNALSALWQPPLINEGFMHWKSEGTMVVTLNLETEIIMEIPLSIPAVVGEEKRSVCCFPTGRYLSLLVSCGDLLWDVWEMKPETGELRKVGNICLEGEKGRMEGLGVRQGDKIKPSGWLKYLEVLAFEIESDYRICRFVCFYNLVKRKIRSEKVILNCRTFGPILHKNTLVSPIGSSMLS